MLLSDLPPLARVLFDRDGCCGIPLLVVRGVKGDERSLDELARLFVSQRPGSSAMFYDSSAAGTAATLIADLQAFVTTLRVDETDAADTRRTVVVSNFQDLPEATRVTFARLIEVACMCTMFVLTTSSSVLDARLASRAVIVVWPSTATPPSPSLTATALGLLETVTRAADAPACNRTTSRTSAARSRAIVMLARCITRCASGPIPVKEVSQAALTPRAWLRVLGMAAIDKAPTDAVRLEIVRALQEADHACACIMQLHDVHAPVCCSADSEDQAYVVSLDAAHARVAQRTVVERFVVAWAGGGRASST